MTQKEQDIKIIEYVNYLRAKGYAIPIEMMAIYSGAINRRILANKDQFDTAIENLKNKLKARKA